MPQEGQYIYAIIETQADVTFGPMGIGKESREVYTVLNDGIAAVISDSPVTKYAVTRANTLAHQKVMETAMKDYPMLPVRFGTVSENTELIRKKLLKDRHQELTETLEYMKDKVELGVKAIWKDMKPVFEDILAKNPNISRLRDRLQKRRGGVQRDQVRLGEMVKNALEGWKKEIESRILGAFEGLYVEQKKNSQFGDQMITNAAFLVSKEHEKKFDQAVERIAELFAETMTLKYVGPIPPCNFVEINVKW
jgi:hypothetical protein